MSLVEKIGWVLQLLWLILIYSANPLLEKDGLTALLLSASALFFFTNGWWCFAVVLPDRTRYNKKWFGLFTGWAIGLFQFGWGFSLKAWPGAGWLTGIAAALSISLAVTAFFKLHLETTAHLHFFQIAFFRSLAIFGAGSLITLLISLS